MIRVLKFKLSNVYDEEEKLELKINDSNSVARLGFAVLAAYDLLDNRPFVINIDGVTYFKGSFLIKNMVDADATKIRDINFEDANEIELIYNGSERIKIVFDNIAVEKEERIFDYPKILSYDDMVSKHGLHFNTEYRIKYWDLKFGYDNLRK